MSYSAPPRRTPSTVGTTGFGGGAGAFKSVSVTPVTKKNTLSSVIDGLVPTTESSSREWSNSALRQQRSRAPVIPTKSFDEEFPALGGAGGAGGSRVPKSVAVAGGAAFAKLAHNWAKADEDKRIAEEHAARARLEQKRREEHELAERRRFYENVHTNRQYVGCDDYDERGPAYYGHDDDYIEGELGEDDVGEVPAPSYHHESEEDEAVDYTISNR